MSNIPQNLTLTHFIDNAMLISPDEQEVASMFVPLAKHMCSKEWRWKIQSTSLLMNFLGIQSTGECQNIPSKLNNKVLSLTPPFTKKVA